LTSRRNFGVHLEWFLWYNHFMNDYGVSHSIGGAPSTLTPPGAVATPKSAGSATPPNCGPTATQPISSGWATTSPGSPTAPKCSPSLVLGHGIQTETSARRSIGGSCTAGSPPTSSCGPRGSPPSPRGGSWSWGQRDLASHRCSPPSAIIKEARCVLPRSHWRRSPLLLP